MSRPNVYIIAGPNGAGKTTFASYYLPVAKCKQFVNADLIAQGLAPFAPASAAMKAGRMVLEQLHTLTDKQLDFAFESTLSGRAYIAFLETLKTKGYKIHIFFLWIPSVELGLSRIKERVAQGGHHVPAKDVRRRYTKSLANFLNDYKSLADHWHMVDNSLFPPRWIAEAEKGKTKILDKALFESIMAHKEKP